MPGKGQENKTVPTGLKVSDFLGSVENRDRVAECRRVMSIMARVTGKRPKMWGDSLIGYGRYHYRYESGREGDFFLTGLSPRKQQLVVYVMPGFDSYRAQLAKLGKHKLGSSCLYLTRLDGIDLQVLEEIIEDSVRVMRERYQVL